MSLLCLREKEELDIALKNLRRTYLPLNKLSLIILVSDWIDTDNVEFVEIKKSYGSYSDGEPASVEDLSFQEKMQISVDVPAKKRR